MSKYDTLLEKAKQTEARTNVDKSNTQYMVPSHQQAVFSPVAFMN